MLKDVGDEQKSFLSMGDKVEFVAKFESMDSEYMRIEYRKFTVISAFDKSENCKNHFMFIYVIDNDWWLYLKKKSIDISEYNYYRSKENPECHIEKILLLKIKGLIMNETISGYKHIKLFDLKILNNESFDILKYYKTVINTYDFNINSSIILSVPALKKFHKLKKKQKSKFVKKWENWINVHEYFYLNQQIINKEKENSNNNKYKFLIKPTIQQTKNFYKEKEAMEKQKRQNKYWNSL